MKAQLLILAVLFTCLNPLLSQDQVTPLANSEIGFNANALISNFLPFDAEEGISSIENLLIFKTGKHDWKFRTSLNFNSSSSTQGNSQIKSPSFLLKMGREKKTRLTKSWVFHQGTEIFYSAFTNNIVTIDPFFGEFESNSTISRFGLDWLYGIQWVINNRFGIGTEGYIFFSRLQERTDFGPNSPVRRETGFDLGIILPQSILFSIYF